MEPEKKTNGAMVGLVVIILILLVGGIYMWQSRTKTAEPENVSAETLPAEDADLSALEQELNASDLDIEASVIDGVE